MQIRISPNVVHCVLLAAINAAIYFEGVSIIGAVCINALTLLMCFSMFVLGRAHESATIFLKLLAAREEQEKEPT